MPFSDPTTITTADSTWKVCDATVRIALCGSRGVGKSSIIRRLVYNDFFQSAQNFSSFQTAGTLLIKLEDPYKIVVRVELWEINARYLTNYLPPAQYGVHSKAKRIYSRAQYARSLLSDHDGYLMVCDAGVDASLDELERFYAELESLCDASSAHKVSRLGLLINKCDKRGRTPAGNAGLARRSATEIIRDAMRFSASKPNLHCYEVSASSEDDTVQEAMLDFVKSIVKARIAADLNQNFQSKLSDFDLCYRHGISRRFWPSGKSLHWPTAHSYRSIAVGVKQYWKATKFKRLSEMLPDLPQAELQKLVTKRWRLFGWFRFRERGGLTESRTFYPNKFKCGAGVGGSDDSCCYFDKSHKQQN